MNRRSLRQICLSGALLAAFAGGAYGAETAATDVLLDVKGFQVLGQNPLSASETDAILLPHLGKHSDLKTLEAAAAALEQRVRDRGFAFYRVILPAQKPSDGVVTLQVLQFPLGVATVTGNQNFSSENILRSLPELEPGKSPDVAELSRQMGLANEHPAKRVSVLMKEGKEKDTVDADVRVRDVPPEQFFANLTLQSRDEYNQINENTGYTRLTLGYQRSDLFDRDHAITATFTTSEQYDNVQQYGLFYWLPLYGYNTSLSAYYARSDVDSGAVGAGASVYNVTGRGEFFGLKASYSLPKYRDTTQSVSLAIDDKFFHSNVDFAGTTETDIRSRPLSLRYSARNDQPWGLVSGYVDYAVNIRGGGSNDDTAYTTSRPGSSPQWDAYHYGLDATYATNNGWGLSARLRGQYSHAPLISGEQFGIGGPGSLRGLRDREVAGDQGYTVSLEALGPPLVDTLQPVVFYDMGNIRLVQSYSPLPTNEGAASLGAGLRWKWQNRLDVSADLAYVLNGVADVGTTPGTESGHMKLNLSVFYRF